MMQSFYEQMVDVCIEMTAGEVVDLDGNLLAELKRRRLIRRPQPSDILTSECDYVISGYGQRLAARVLRSRELKSH